MLACCFFVSRGKGVYFAASASYSVDTKYSVPNSDGVQHLFLCRVIVGEYCLGHEGCVAPDERDSSNHLRFDSTVDRMVNPNGAACLPGIFVTYHDSQAYPEYLISFRQG